MDDTPIHASLSSEIPFLPFQDKELSPSFIHTSAIAPLHLIRGSITISLRCHFHKASRGELQREWGVGWGGGLPH